ncbi:MAG: hypothetical protein GY765_37860, partial [bacterium]|nr:hypothetical protein [bacterium]
MFFVGLLLPALDPTNPLTDYSTDEWQKKNGFPADAVFSITQTENGYLWFGTAEGLVRYDGMTFKTYLNSNQYSNIYDKQVLMLFADKERNLWYGDSEGLKLFKDGKIKIFPFQGGLPWNTVAAIFRDSYGTLWVSTMHNSLHYLKNGTLTPLNSTEPPAGKFVLSFYEDSRGICWVGTITEGLFFGERGQFKRYKIDSSHLQYPYSVYAIYRDSLGVLWVGTDRGLAVFPTPLVETNGMTRFYNRKNGLSGDNITAICEDRDKNVWVGTRSGLNRLKRETGGGVQIDTCLQRSPSASVRNRPASQVGVPIHCLFEDMEGNLWVGTDGIGLRRLKDIPIKTY